MILSDSDIRNFKSNTNTPLVVNNENNEIYVGPSSVDLTLSNSFSFLEKTNLVKFDSKINYIEVNTNTYLLQAGEFVLASTQETINLPDNISAFVQGRSSIGRLGLQIQNAGFIDAGFIGEITLELHNQGPCPILLEKGKRICQVVFFKQQSASENVYNGKYQNQTGATGSKIYLDN
jgi:dCTP deaminase